MAIKTNNIAKSGRPYGAVWFALLSVAWLQFSIAVHQFDHVAGFAEGSCDVCVQLERSDDLVADTSAVPHIHAEQGPLVRESAGTFVAWDLVAGFNPRAPPSI